MEKDSDLKSRILFTIGVLILYRIGTFIPLPGIRAEVISKFFSSDFANIFGMVNVFSGGALERMSIFALNIMPYITASIIIQLASVVYGGLEELKKEGEYGKEKMEQYTKYLTLVLALFQAMGIYYAFSRGEQSAFVGNTTVFMLTTVGSLVAGTMLLMWLGDKINENGVGNGISLLICIGIISGLPSAFTQVLDLSRSGGYSGMFVLGFLAVFCVFMALITFCERLTRKVKIQYPGNRGMMVGKHMPDSSFLPIKINISGVIPPIFANSLLMFPMVFVQLFAPTKAGLISTIFMRGSIWYYLIYAVLIVFFCFFYTALVFNTNELAENLKRNNSFILGIRPGKSTEEYLDKVVSYLTAIGSLYLLIVCIVPEVMIAKFALPLHISGTGMMIVVSVIMETTNQIQSYMLSGQYGSLTKRRRIKVR